MINIFFEIYLIIVMRKILLFKEDIYVCVCVSGTLQSHQITIEQSIYKKRRREEEEDEEKKTEKDGV
jgi:hypothetical protein